MNINPVFFQIFGNFFNVDLINLDDVEKLREEANFCAATLCNQVSDLQSLKTDLSQFLHEWNSGVILKLIETTNVDWFFDEETEESLRFIITHVVEALETC